MGDAQPGPNALEVSLSPASPWMRLEWPSRTCVPGKPGRLLRHQTQKGPGSAKTAVTVGHGLARPPLPVGASVPARRPVNKALLCSWPGRGGYFSRTSHPARARRCPAHPHELAPLGVRGKLSQAQHLPSSQTDHTSEIRSQALGLGPAMSTEHWLHLCLGPRTRPQSSFGKEERRLGSLPLVSQPLGTAGRSSGGTQTQVCEPAEPMVLTTAPHCPWGTLW